MTLTFCGEDHHLLNSVPITVRQADHDSFGPKDVNRGSCHYMNVEHYYFPKSLLQVSFTQKLKTKAPVSLDLESLI